MSVWLLCAMAALLAAAAFALREFGWRGVPLFGVLCALCVLSRGMEALRELVPAFTVLWQTGLSDSLAAAMKIIGIGYLSSITADICRDLGEGGIARAVILSARMEILLVALPFFKAIVEIGQSLLI